MSGNHPSLWWKKRTAKTAKTPAALSDDTTSSDESQLRGRRRLPQLPAWPLFRIGNRDRYAVAQDQRDRNPAVGYVQSSSAVGESDQAFVGYGVELRERRKIPNRFGFDPQRRLIRELRPH
jgi:hypothetical protein